MGSPQTDQERIVQLEVRVKELEEWQESFSSGIIKAFGTPEPVGCRHIWEITNTTGGKVYKCVKCPAVKSHDYDNIPEPSGTISDGFGSTWGPCPTCQGAMEVVRPGKAQCSKCG